MSEFKVVSKGSIIAQDGVVWWPTCYISCPTQGKRPERNPKCVNF